MTMNRQQRRKEARKLVYTNEQIITHRRTHPMGEITFQKGYQEGWQAACDFAMKTCYAAAVLAMHDIAGYGLKRNRRLLRKMDSYVVNTLDKDEAIEEALQKAGVWINFRATFDDERIQEATKE